jgi:hypothetical protein
MGKKSAVSAKPKKVNVDHRIDKGERGRQASAVEVPVKLRVPEATLARIDKAVSERQNHSPIRIPRHGWIMEAIHDKLAREGV